MKQTQLSYNSAERLWKMFFRQFDRAHGIALVMDLWVTRKVAALLAIAAIAIGITGCATEGPAPRTHADKIHIGVNPTNNTPEVDITKYDNPKDLLISYDPATRTFSLKSSNNPGVIDSSSAANAAYVNAISQLINSAIAQGAAAAGAAAKAP